MTAEQEFKQVMGGLLVQDRDLEFADRTEMEIVTKRQPTDEEWRDLMFAWRVCKNVRSNAIVLAKNESTAGIGAGQMSRVDSVRLAVDKSRLESLEGAVLASDAFFPFSDGPEIAIGAGVTAIIQPGGSRRDADGAGIAMVFTSRRHFRH
jgi:phosphoribosylaminoimidazolecarboxamide formyltransferase/IMP cyclohydrolase